MSQPQTYIKFGNLLVAGTSTDKNHEFVKSKDYAELKEELLKAWHAGIAMSEHLPDTDEAKAAYLVFEKLIK
jgi:hypothetical protein